ncbi:MAG: hypothetical protein RL434_1104, partial [Pseudomonadota bacterium]
MHEPGFTERDDGPAQVERFLDSLWVEDGISDNTLKAYRTDLRSFSAFLARHARTLDMASESDILG